MTDPTWIFGYGSLVWRPAFAYRERRPCVVRGYARRFFQGSTDHRGVPEAPGRVVTLLPDPAAECWGVAYAIEPTQRDRILDQLEVREQGGYDCIETFLEFAAHGAHPVEKSGEGVSGLMYVATPANRNYLGEAPLHEIAEQVRRSQGPSGHNLEYVLRLAEALRAIGAHDDHVFELERHLRSAAA